LATYWEGIEHGPQMSWFPDGRKKHESVSNGGQVVGEWTGR
jgi:antitoxin component YwqK of YwqJK toxin-antitoxin module